MNETARDPIAPTWSPLPEDATETRPTPPAGLTGPANPDRYADPIPNTPPWLVSRLGVATSAIQTVFVAAVVILFTPLNSDRFRGLVGSLPSFAMMLAVIVVALPILIGLLGIFPLRALGITNLTTKNYRWRTQPNNLEETNARLRRVLPFSRAMIYLGWLQLVLFVVFILAVVITIAATGRAHTIPLELGIGLNGWLAIQVLLGGVVMSDRGANAMCAASSLAVISYHLVAPGAPIIERMLLITNALLLATLMLVGQRFLLETVRNAEVINLETQTHTSATADLDAAVAEAGRIEDLIHDNILSCLLLTSRGGAEDEWAAGAIKTHAAAALETLDEIADPKPPPPLTPVQPGDFTRTLADQVRMLDARIGLDFTGKRRQPIPAEVAHTLSSAVLEAVRNSLRHAEGTLLRGDNAVVRKVTASISDYGISIEVYDTGVGFDPASLPPRTMGLRDSILKRVQQLPGGHAGIASAPMLGTSVHMSWIQPLDSEPEASPESDTAKDPSPVVRTGYRLRDPEMNTFMAGAMILLTATVIVTLPRFNPWWFPLLVLCSLILFAWGLSRQWATQTGAPPAWMWPLFGLIPAFAMGLGLVSTPEYIIVGGMSWIDIAVVMMLVILALGRYYAAAWIGGLTVTAMYLVWIYTSGHPNAPFVGPWPIHIITVAFCTFIGAWTKSHIDEAAERQQERDESIARHLEQAEVLRQRQARSAELDVVVRPLITRLAGDDPVTPEVEVEAGLLEARLRDDMRARCFHGTDVSRAAWDARARGVFVELFDEGGLNSASSALQDAVVAVVAGRLDQTNDGQVTVRVLPNDRDIVATVLHQPPSGPKARTEIYEDGRARTETK